MEHFSYHSEQVHSAFRNGKGETRRNTVNIKNGKGTKSVETYMADGKIKSRSEKALTVQELDCIHKNKFIPGLFKDCIKPIRRTLRKKRSTTRRRAH
jgi:hypothetical protein